MKIAGRKLVVAHCPAFFFEKLTCLAIPHIALVIIVASSIPYVQTSGSLLILNNNKLMSSYM